MMVEEGGRECVVFAGGVLVVAEGSVVSESRGEVVMSVCVKLK